MSRLLMWARSAVFDGEAGPANDAFFFFRDSIKSRAAAYCDAAVATAAPSNPLSRDLAKSLP